MWKKLPVTGPLHRCPSLSKSPRPVSATKPLFGVRLHGPRRASPKRVQRSSMSVPETVPQSSPASRAAHQVAVIDIGTSSIRMAIAEIQAGGGVRTLESFSQAVNLGKDTFTRGNISKGTIEDSVRVLKSYRRMLQE